jgi:hypothetical protein
MISRIDSPQQHRHLQRAVHHQQVFRRAAFLLDLDQVQVAEDAVQHKGDGQHHGVVGRQVGRREGVQAVGQNGGAETMVINWSSSGRL